MSENDWHSNAYEQLIANLSGSFGFLIMYQSTENLEKRMVKQEVFIMDSLLYELCYEKTSLWRMRIEHIQTRMSAVSSQSS